MKIKSCLLCLIWLLLCQSCHTATPFIPVFTGNCVDRSVEIREFLKAKGYQSELVVSIIHLDGKKQAHMWIKYKKPQEQEWKAYKNLRCEENSRQATPLRPWKSW